MTRSLAAPRGRGLDRVRDGIEPGAGDDLGRRPDHEVRVHDRVACGHARPTDAPLPAAGPMEHDRGVADLRTAARGGRQRDDREAAGLDALPAEQGSSRSGVGRSAAAFARSMTLPPPTATTDRAPVASSRRARARTATSSGSPADATRSTISTPASARAARTSVVAGFRSNARNVTRTVRVPAPAATIPTDRRTPRPKRMRVGSEKLKSTGVPVVGPITGSRSGPGRSAAPRRAGR